MASRILEAELGSCDIGFRSANPPILKHPRVRFKGIVYIAALFRFKRARQERSFLFSFSSLFTQSDLFQFIQRMYILSIDPTYLHFTNDKVCG